MNACSLSNGDALPAVGLGMWKNANEQCAEVVRMAVDIGYRHFDSACDYGNEVETGQGLKMALDDGLCVREELWITSKLWNTYHAAEHVRPACERSLSDLGLDYLDLYLIHFPISQRFVPFETRYPPEWFFDPDAAEPKIELDPVPVRETWEAMEALKEAGLVRHIGISNFGTSMIRDLLSYARIRPDVLQIELHPYNTQENLLRYCREEGIAVTGFSPLGAESYYSLGMAEPAESLFNEAVVRSAAERCGKTPAQVLLRWGIQRGTSVVPKSSNPDRLAENLAVFDFSLSDEEMTAISALDRGRRFNDPGAFAEVAFNTFLPIYE